MQRVEIRKMEVSGVPREVSNRGADEWPPTALPRLWSICAMPVSEFAQIVPQAGQVVPGAGQVLTGIGQIVREPASLANARAGARTGSLNPDYFETGR